jgi:hypothetical protein
MARASKGSCFQTLGFIHNAMQYRCGRPAIEPIISRFAPSSKYTPKFPAHQSPRVPIALGVLNSAHSPSDRAWRNRIFNLGTSPYSHPNEKKKRWRHGPVPSPRVSPEYPDYSEQVWAAHHRAGSFQIHTSGIHEYFMVGVQSTLKSASYLTQEVDYLCKREINSRTNKKYLTISPWLSPE